MADVFVELEDLIPDIDREINIQNFSMVAKSPVSGKQAVGRKVERREEKQKIEKKKEEEEKLAYTPSKRWKTNRYRGRYQCDYRDCNFSCQNATALGVHYRVHTGERPYPCLWPGCDYAATQKSNLHRHLRVHTGQPHFKCPNCKSRFTRKFNLRVHLEDMCAK